MTDYNAIIKDVVSRHPQLAPKAQFPDEQALALAACIEWLRPAPLTKSFPKKDARCYHLKHVIEKMRGRYVEDKIVTIAADHLGIPWKSCDDGETYLCISLKWLKQEKEYARGNIKGSVYHPSNYCDLRPPQHN
jgi:hypothetical protein